MLRSKRTNQVERYELNRSPLAQNPTQSDLAKLLGMKRSELRALATYRDTWIVRREAVISNKVRHLAYPRGKLRRVHERLKFHLKKIQQPDYLYSPRVGRSQRDYASLHLGQQQYLTLDLKQFYPSTTEGHIFDWAKHELGMRDDVAGLFTRLVSVDEAASFGSPLTPVLASLVHRKLFDAIAKLCKERGLRISLWVDDLTISGNFVPGILLNAIRELIRVHRLRSHKLRYRTGNRPVTLTGLLVDGDRLRAPRTVHERIQTYYEELSNAPNDVEAEIIIGRLLSALGSLRFIVGRSTNAAKSASDQMNTLRQRRSKSLRAAACPVVPAAEQYITDGNAPWVQSLENVEEAQ